MSTCRTCRYWSGIKETDKAVCMLSKMRHPKMHSGCGLRTTIDFGCNQHAEKTKGLIVKTNN